jgi:GT2 family glycosyltransferase
LPLTIQAVCNQTVKPARILIFDDGEQKDLRGDPLYQHLFGLMSFYGIRGGGEIIFGERKGQVANHIKSLELADTEWIWRNDDDTSPEPDVLEKLLKNIQPDVGAVGGLIIAPNNIHPLPSIASNKIEDIYLGLNEQWFVHPENSPAREVDHLYCSFIYRRDIATYTSNLSPIGHREETLLTYNMKLKGYKNILDPSARTWHLNNPGGGIRDKEFEKRQDEFAHHDEAVFRQSLNTWGVKPIDHSCVVVEHGLGDHYALKSILPNYFQKEKNKKHIFFVTFPEVFQDVPNIHLASIADAKTLFGENLDRFNLYKWMIDVHWNKNLPAAFKQFLSLPGEFARFKFGNLQDIKRGTGDTIIISPYSYAPDHAKSYPYWKELVVLLKTLNLKLVQIGKPGEVPLENMDDYWWGLSLKELEKKVSECQVWISVDNFLQHLVNAMPTPIKGITIWGVSDPKLFGYPHNLNILKSEKYFRPDQFNVWFGLKQNKEAFETPAVIFNKIKQFLQ